MRPTRTADDLIGKRVHGRDRALLPRSKRAGSRMVFCVIRGVRTNKDGKLMAIYVTKEGRKTKIRIPVDNLTVPIQRYRGEGQTSYRWEFEMDYRGKPLTNGVVRMDRNQHGCNSKEFQSPTIAWWLNNPDVLKQDIIRTKMDHKDGRPLTRYLRDPKTGLLPNGRGHAPLPKEFYAKKR